MCMRLHTTSNENIRCVSAVFARAKPSELARAYGALSDTWITFEEK